MQLLGSLSQRRLEGVPAPLRVALEDIVNQIQIESNFCIRHPDYQPLELPTEAVERFQQLPQELQQKYLGLQLRGFLYGIYYNGSLREALAPEAESDRRDLQQNLENNTFLGVDLAFYEQLHAANSSEGYFDPGWQVMQQEEDGSFAVTKHGLTLHIEPDRHLPLEAQSPTVGDRVAIRLPKNRVQNGFYMAMGNSSGDQRPRSLTDQPNTSSQDETVRVYFNLSAEGAIDVMSSLTQQLNAAAIPFSFKALYNPSDYGRSDSAVLYIDKRDYPTVHSVLQSTYLDHQAQFHAAVPLFTKCLAPGLAIAEEPKLKFAELESFGMNRCQIVANALLDTWQQGETAPQPRIEAIYQHFSLLGIELHRPYLNANSEDIYMPLAL